MAMERNKVANASSESAVIINNLMKVRRPNCLLIVM